MNKISKNKHLSEINTFTVLDKTPFINEIPILNPLIKEDFIEKLKIDNRNLESLENELSNTLTLINSLNLQIKNLTDTENYNKKNKVIKNNLKNPTNEDLKKGNDIQINLF